VFTGCLSKCGVIALIAGFFKTILVLRKKTLSAPLVVLSGHLHLFLSPNTVGLSFAREMIKEKVSPISEII
jgi:hypothetical protein